MFGAWPCMMSHPFSKIYRRLNLLRLTHGPSVTFCFSSASEYCISDKWSITKKTSKTWYFAGYLFSYLGRPLAFSSFHPRFNPTVAWIPHHVILQEEPKHSRSDEDGQDAGDPQKNRSGRNPWRPTVAVQGKRIYGLGNRLGNQVNLGEKHLCVKDWGNQGRIFLVYIQWVHTRNALHNYPVHHTLSVWDSDMVREIISSWWFQPLWKVLVKLEVFPK